MPKKTQRGTLWSHLYFWKHKKIFGSERESNPRSPGSKNWSKLNKWTNCKKWTTQSEIVNWKKLPTVIVGFFCLREKAPTNNVSVVCVACVVGPTTRSTFRRRWRTARGWWRPCWWMRSATCTDWTSPTETWSWRISCSTSTATSRSSTSASPRRWSGTGQRPSAAPPSTSPPRSSGLIYSHYLPPPQIYLYMGEENHNLCCDLFPNFAKSPGSPSTTWCGNFGFRRLRKPIAFARSTYARQNYVNHVFRPS